MDIIECALTTIRGAIPERFPPGSERNRGLAWAQEMLADPTNASDMRKPQNAPLLLDCPRNGTLTRDRRLHANWSSRGKSYSYVGKKSEEIEGRDFLVRQRITSCSPSRTSAGTHSPPAAVFDP